MHTFYHLHMYSQYQTTCVYILKHGNFKYIHIFQQDVSYFIYKCMGNLLGYVKLF